ncbi:MAG: hypothetical protein ACOH2L_06160 [Devosia sp.]
MSKFNGLALGLAFFLAACSPIVPNSSTHQGGTRAQTVVGAPGPVAGIGLPILALVGGFLWKKSRKRRPDRLKE